MIDESAIVCYCQSVSKTTILCAIHEGADTVEAIIDQTRAGLACGSCIETLETMLETFKK